MEIVTNDNGVILQLCRINFVQLWKHKCSINLPAFVINEHPGFLRWLGKNGPPNIETWLANLPAFSTDEIQKFLAGLSIKHSSETTAADFLRTMIVNLPVSNTGGIRGFFARAANVTATALMNGAVKNQN